MHPTASSDFYAYNDLIDITDNTLTLKGWVFSPNIIGPNYYIKINDVVFDMPVADIRVDVANAYNARNFLKCGYNFKINIDQFPVVHKIDLFTSYRDTFLLNLFTNTGTTSSSQHSFELLDGGIINNVPSFIVVDNFYSNPDEIRNLALSLDYNDDLRYHKGKRTNQRYFVDGTQRAFEKLLGTKITRFHEYDYNGVFQYCTPEDPLVYHCDVQSYAATIYLTPDAPPECGTSFYRSKQYPHIRKVNENDSDANNKAFAGGYYDKTKFDLVDTVGNVYNRLVIWDSRLIHSASQYFGNDKYNSRLFHLFFFDIDL